MRESERERGRVRFYGYHIVSYFGGGGVKFVKVLSVPLQLIIEVVHVNFMVGFQFSNADDILYVVYY